MTLYIFHFLLFNDYIFCLNVIHILQHILNIITLRVPIENIFWKINIFNVKLFVAEVFHVCVFLEQGRGGVGR